MIPRWARSLGCIEQVARLRVPRSGRVRRSTGPVFSMLVVATFGLQAEAVFNSRQHQSVSVKVMRCLGIGRDPKAAGKQERAGRLFLHINCH